MKPKVEYVDKQPGGWVRVRINSPTGAWVRVLKCYSELDLPATVGWQESIIGRDADYADGYAGAIKFAAQIARRLDRGEVPEEGEEFDG